MRDSIYDFHPAFIARVLGSGFLKFLFFSYSRCGVISLSEGFTKSKARSFERALVFFLSVIPAQAGIPVGSRDSRFHGNDDTNYH